MEDEAPRQLPTLLTEPEVARLLRCSTSKIKRLRRAGLLAYLPGRPVLVESAALDRYLNTIRREPRPLTAARDVSAEAFEAAGARARAVHAKYTQKQRDRKK